MKGILKIKVSGMHCPACALLVQREFSQVPGAAAVKVSLAQESAEITWEAEAAPEIRSYAERIEPFGYGVQALPDSAELDRPEPTRPAEQGGHSSDPRSASTQRVAVIAWVKALIFAALFIGGYLAIGKSGLADGLGAGTEGTIPAALLAGVAASVSTCLALVGSLVLALGTYAGAAGAAAAVGSTVPVGSAATAGAPSAAASAGAAAPTGGAVPLRRNLAFQAGRIASFILLGGALGALGATFSFSSMGAGLTTVAAGVLALILGAGLLLPKSRGIPSFLPRSFSRRLDTLAASGNPLAPVLLGAATFFLPCGFALSMQALAVASGGFLQGAMIMGAFALGTAPVLTAVGLAGSWTKRRGPVLQRASGLVVVFFALQSMVGGLALFGLGSQDSQSVRGFSGSAPAVPPAAAAPAQSSAASAGEAATVDQKVQVVEMRVGPSSFTPSVIKIKAGVPVEWVIIGENPSGCTNRIIVPGTDLSVPVRKGSRQTVAFTAPEPGTIAFSCWMSMVHGKFIVE